MVKQTEKFLEKPNNLKNITKKVANQKTTVKPQILESNVYKLYKPNFLGTILVEVFKVV